VYFKKIDNFTEKPKFCHSVHFRGKTANSAARLNKLCGRGKL